MIMTMSLRAGRKDGRLACCAGSCPPGIARRAASLPAGRAVPAGRAEPVDMQAAEMPKAPERSCRIGDPLAG